MNIDQFWDLIEPFDWGTKTTKYEEIEKALLHKLTPAQAGEVREIFNTLRIKLHCTIGVRGCIQTGWNEDRCYDLCAHIIGLGRIEYNAVLADPSLGVKRGQSGDYVESFSYALPYEDAFVKIDINYYVERAEEIAVYYQALAEIDEDTFPWRPKVLPELHLICATMQAFAEHKDIGKLLTQGTVLVESVKLIADYVQRLNLERFAKDLSLFGLLEFTSNPHHVSNFVHDLERYMT